MGIIGGGGSVKIFWGTFCLCRHVAEWWVNFASRNKNGSVAELIRRALYFGGKFIVGSSPTGSQIIKQKET